MGVAADRKMWSVDDSTLTVSTNRSNVAGSTVEGAARPVWAHGEQFVYVTGGVRIQKWGPSLANATTLTNSPPCTHVVSLSSRLVANDTANPTQFKYSDQFEGNYNNWSSPGGGTVIIPVPDPIVGIYDNLAELFIFCRSNVLVYQPGQGETVPGTNVIIPWSLANSFALGLAAPYAVVKLDQQFIILDDKLRISVTNGRQVEPISAPIQRDLRRLSDVSDAWAYREEKDQQSYVVFRFPTAKRTFTFDLKNKKWGERDYYDQAHGLTGADVPINDVVYRNTDNRHIAASSKSGITYATIDGDIRTDFGVPIVCRRLTGWQNFGNVNRKRSVRVRVILRRGTAPENSTPGQLEARVQDDDSAWSEWHTESIGTPSQFEQTVDFFFGGVFRRRRYEFRYTNTDNTVLAEAHEDYRELST
jgi:hypothetical protein